MSDQPSVPGGPSRISDILKLVPGREVLNPIPESIRRVTNLLRASQEGQRRMGGGLPRVLRQTPEEYISGHIGYVPTFWEDPRRIARFHQSIQALPEDAPLPDWLDRDRLNAAYNYLKYRNKSAPWYEWEYLHNEDPARQFLQGMPNPPIDMLMPEEVTRYLQEREQQGEYEAAQVEAMAWPERGSPEWEELPGWMKVAMTTMASGTWYGQAIGGALTLGPWGAVTGLMSGGPVGGVVGAISGGLMGGAIALGTGAAARWLGEFRETHPDAEWTTGASKVLENVLMAFDVGAEVLERGLGVATQINYAMDDPDRYGPVSEIFENFMSSWRAGTQFWTALPLEGIIPGGAELGERWVLGEPEPVREVMDPRTGEMMQIPQPEDNWDAFALFADELTRCRRELMEGTKSPEEQVQEMAIKYGWSGQFTELAAHIILDPGPWIAKRGPTMGLKALGGWIGNDAMVAAADLAKAMKREGIFGNLRAYGQVLRLDTPIEQVTAGGLLTRYLGGVTAEGEPSLLQQPRGPLGWLFGLTPRSRAVEVLGITSDTAKIVMDQFDDPLEVGLNWRKIADTPGDAAADLSMRFIESPDGMLTVMAMRDFGDGALRTLETQWVSTEMQRGILAKIARLRGIPEFEVLKLLEDPEQGPAFFKSIIDEASKAADADPAAAELLKAAEAGQFTEQTLRDLFKLYMEEGVAWHPEHWKAQLYDAWMTHVAEWSVARLGVKVEPMIMKLSSLMKSVQSLALLDVNPLYAINNGVNNISTMIIDGTFRLKTIKNALQWWDEFGLRPYRLRQAYGGVAGLSEFAGRSLADLELLAKESPEASRLVTEIKASRAVADAAVGDGALANARRWVGQLRRKVGFASGFSRKIEEWSSVQATTAGAQQFWSRSWRAGVGYSRLPPAIEGMLGPEISRMVYGMVEGALNADQLEGALLKQATIRGTVESFVSDVARDLGQDPGDVAEIMQRSGATDFLNVHLRDAKTPDEVRGVFSMLDQHVQRQVDQLAVSEYVSRVQHSAAQIKAGDYTGFLETWFHLNRTADEWWTKHVMEWSMTMEEVSKITDGKQRNQIIAARMASANSDATRMQSFEMAAIEGMVEGMRDLGLDVPRGCVDALRSQHEGWRGFYGTRDTLWREYFKTDFESKTSKRLRYTEIVNELDSLYGRQALETLQLQEQMDMGVVNMVARSDPDLADSLNNWFTEARELRATMNGREQNVRRANYDILTSEHATGKSFATIIQAHFASDPEFLTAISPWLQQLKARKGRLRYDDILVIRNRLYAEYLNNLKLPDIKEYFERRNQGLVDALSEDLTRPLPMPAAPEVPTPEIPTRFVRVQQDLESGRAQVTMSSSDLLDMVRRADETITRLNSDRSRPGAGGQNMPLWDQALDLDVTRIQEAGQTPGAFWWASSNAEVRDGILSLPEVKGSEKAAQGLLDAVYNARQGPEIPDVDVKLMDNDLIRKLAWEQGGIQTTSDSGAPLNAYLINWINSVLGLREAGTPIKSLDDLTDQQRMVVRLELYKRGQRRGVMEEEAIRTRMTVEALEVLDDWADKPCGVRKLRRLGIHNGLGEGEVANMSADEIHSWLIARRTGQPYTGARYMTPDFLRQDFLELSGGEMEVAASTMALIEAAATAKGISIDEYVAQVFARQIPGEDPVAQQQLFQMPVDDAVRFRYSQSVESLMKALIEKGLSEDDAATLMAKLTTDEPWAKFVTGDLDSLRAMMYEYRDAQQEVDYMERVGRPITFGDVVSRSEMRSGKPVDADVRAWFGEWQLIDKNTNRVLRIFPTEEAARAALDAVKRQGIYEDTSLPYTLLQRADRNSPLIPRAVDMFGTTEIPAEAGFILPDGRMLDFSGRNYGMKDLWGAPAEGGKLLEHMEIAEAFEAPPPRAYGSPINAIARFNSETGSIRITFNRREGRPWLGLQLSGPLSIEQIIAVHKILGESARGMLRIDCLDPVTNKLIKDLWVDGLTRESINEVFSDVESVYSYRQPGKGAVTFLEDGRAVLRALENPDASTCIHELGHVFRRQLPDTDLDTVVKWWQTEGKLKVRHEQGELIGDTSTIRKAEEMWARGFEKYMAEGVAPIPTLSSIFERFKRWIMAVYQKITGSAIDVPLSDEVRGIMDHILAQDPETARKVQPGFDWSGGEARAPVAPVPGPEGMPGPWQPQFVPDVQARKLGYEEGVYWLKNTETGEWMNKPSGRRFEYDTIEEANRAITEINRSMPEGTPIRTRNEITGAYSGQTNGTLMAIDPQGTRVGFIDWQQLGDEVLIADIRVPEELRRTGIGTRLYQDLVKEFPDKEINWGMMTEEGVALKKSVEADITAKPPELPARVMDLLVRTEQEPSEITVIKTPEEYKEFFSRYGPPNVVPTEDGTMFGKGTGSIFVNDDTGKFVGYAPARIESGPRKGMDLHDWQVARNAELRLAASIEDPQARIDAVNSIVEGYQDVKHHNWVTSETLAARIRAQAKAELRVVEGIPGLVGAGTAAHGPDPNVQYEFLYRVIELRDLVASHDKHGNKNPDYPDFLQPRDRARAVSQQQVQRIAGDLNPDSMLMPTTRIDDGTPIIGEDAIVESGNARVIALGVAAETVPESFANYTNRLIELLVGNADEYGDFDLEQVRAMDQPVLVRVRTSRDVDRVEFTRLANESATMGMSFSESAQADVNRLSVDSLATLRVPEDWGLEQALRSPKNRGFVQGFVDQLPRNEVAMVVDPEGALSRKGMERLIAAMFAKTYHGDAGVRLVRTVFESQDINIRNVAKGLTMALGEMAKAEALIGAERRPLSLSIGNDLAAAVDKMQFLKVSGMSVDNYIAQLVLFGRDLTPFQEMLLVDLNNMIRSPKAIRQVLEEYARLVQIQPDVDQLGLFGEVEYPPKIELWERAKRGPQETFFQLPEGTELGPIDGVPPELWMSQVTADGWDQIRPVIDGMKEKMAGPDGWTQEIGMDDVQTRLNAEQQVEFRDWVRSTRGEMASTKMGAVRWGEAARDQSLLNYNARRGLDVIATTGMPYWFWPSRTFLNWAMRTIDRPSLIANLARTRHLQQHYQTVPGFPQRLKGKVRVPMPFLPEWMGGGLWVDPLRSLFPPAMFLSLVDRVANVKKREVGKAEVIISNWVVEGKVDSAAAEHALVTREGDIWDRALDQARLEEGEQFSGPMDYISLLTSFSLPIEIARQYAKGTPENIGPLPVTRLIKGVTAPLGIGGPGGINIEAPIRRAAGLPDYDKFEEYRVERMVSNMIADGIVSPEEGELAMNEHRGEAWDEAERRVNMARFYGTYANPLFWFGFPADSFPTGEAAQRALSRKWAAAIEARNAGDDTALTEFLEEYPEYKSRLDLFKDPEERLRYFLVDEIWTRYMALGSSNKEMVRLQLGEDFMYSFLSKETRSYEDLSINILAFWARRLGGYLPESTDNRIEIPEQIRETPGVELLDPTLSLAVDTYRELRNEKHPNWFAMQQGYYELPPGGQRRNYLVQFPRLKKYWDWRKGYLNDHPDVKAYGQRYDLESGEGESLGTLSVPEILTNAALMRQILGNRMTGEPLSSGALSELYRIWDGLNRPFDDVEIWIKRLDMTP